MKFRYALLPLIVVVPSLLVAQTNNFELHLAGKPIGKANYSIGPAKNGLKLTSRYSFHMVGPDGARSESDFLDDFKFDASYKYLDGTIDDKVHLKNRGLLPNKNFTEMSISQYSGGSEPTTFITIAPNLMMLPNFDVGAAQAALLLATTHPTSDNKYALLVPAPGGGGGSGGGRGRGKAPDAASTGPDAQDAALPGDRSVEAIWVKGTPFTGTLDGKPLNVNSYMLAVGKFRWLFFADESNNLMQLNVSMLHASYIRENFKLDPPKSVMAR